ncbi:MAG TPA: hypothetical protein GXZ87_07525 [Bacteroidales bacterium]|nr:hypothetical protein [Bacteroidales bacterium]
MKIRIISGRLGMSGTNIQFQNEDFFTLKVGDMVRKIGDGREHGLKRTDEFVEPIEYVGSIICQFSEKEKMYAFRLPQIINNENLYLLYGKTDSEVFTESIYSPKGKKSYVRFYEPNFVKLSDSNNN